MMRRKICKKNFMMQNVSQIILFVWRRKQFDRKLCVVDSVKYHGNIVFKLCKDRESFFCTIKYLFKSKHKFFKNSILERN